MIPITKSVFGVEELEAVKRPLISGWITQGPEVAAFELEFADFVGSNFACAVSSCTAAMHLALLAVGVVPGDEVVTVSHSFIATANSVSLCGAAPVFSDIILDTYNMSPGERADFVFVANNPGLWLFHCHMLEHHAAGMGGIVNIT